MEHVPVVVNEKKIILVVYAFIYSTCVSSTCIYYSFHTKVYIVSVRYQSFEVYMGLGCRREAFVGVKVCRSVL